MKSQMLFRDFFIEFERGTVEVDDIGRGMHLCYKNACDLIEDAELLMPKRPARSISLTILALEEIGKILLLCEKVAQSGGPIEWETVYKEFKSHGVKQKALVQYGSVFLDSLAVLEGKERHYSFQLPPEATSLLDRFKQLGFYVDCHKGSFVCPDVVGRDNCEFAPLLIAMVKERLEDISFLHKDEGSSIALARLAKRIASENKNIETKTDAVNLIRKLRQEMDEEQG